MRSVPGIVAERCRGADTARRGWRSGQNMADHAIFWAPQEGGNRSFCPCQRKHRIFGAFFLYLRQFTVVLLAFSIYKTTAHGHFRTPNFHFCTVFCSLCATQSTQSVWYIIKKASIIIQIRL